MFDPEGDRALLIGTTALAQLTLAGTPTWSQLAIGGPPPPTPSTSNWFYDSKRNRVVVLSGAWRQSAPLVVI